ncbi:internal scaffolding protein [Apis mellifera associated microvirus 21]|nr:internal scaffolding protein [Apis mellifera associated microvirus 21]
MKPIKETKEPITEQSYKLVQYFADGRINVETVNNDPSLARTEFQKQSDINEIMRNYDKTGVIDLKNHGLGHFVDLVDLPTYQESLDLVIAAEESFMALPAETRKRFSNDPGEMIKFLQDPENKKEAQKLGLVNPDKPTPEPTTNQLLTEINTNLKNQNQKPKIKNQNTETE